MKKAIVGLKTIKTERPIELLHIEAQKPVTAKITKRDDGFYLLYTRLNPEPTEEDQPVSIHLTVEDGLDKEDLRNVNEILEQERLNFVKWG